MKMFLRILIVFILSIVSAYGQNIKIGFISAPSVIGSYSQTLYSVALASALGKDIKNVEIINIKLKDESQKSLEDAKLQNYDAIIAALTANGVKNLLKIEPTIPIFIPTLHKRDFPQATENIVFGAIDYAAQIKSLLPLSANTIHIFYDQSPTGEQLKNITNQLIKESSSKKQVYTYSVNAKGDNITNHFKSSAKFNNATIILHLPLVKSALVASYIRAIKIREKSILSTQIIYDPALIGLIQSENHKNMTIANSLTTFDTRIFEANEIMSNNILYNWMSYTTSVGIDYLISILSDTHRSYNLQILNNQVVYPIELVKPREFGFEPIVK